MFTTFPQCNFLLEFPEILRQNLIRYHWLSVSKISKIMHCGILINMPFWVKKLTPLSVHWRHSGSVKDNFIKLLCRSAAMCDCCCILLCTSSVKQCMTWKLHRITTSNFSLHSSAWKALYFPQAHLNLFFIRAESGVVLSLAKLSLWINCCKTQKI